jgi:HPt (histidine-containing phosphotransfer) domain-containing protein
MPVSQRSAETLRLARLEEITEGDREFERELLESLLGEVRGSVERIGSAFMDRDADALAAELHALRGACRTVGAEALAKSSEELELLSRAGCVVPDPEQFRELEELANQLLGQVEARLAG